MQHVPPGATVAHAAATPVGHRANMVLGITVAFGFTVPTPVDQHGTNSADLSAAADTAYTSLLVPAAARPITQPPGVPTGSAHDCTTAPLSSNISSRYAAAVPVVASGATPFPKRSAIADRPAAPNEVPPPATPPPHTAGVIVDVLTGVTVGRGDHEAVCEGDAVTVAERVREGDGVMLLLAPDERVADGDAE